MPSKLGVSGSTILSKAELFTELFWEDIHHIEIGEFFSLTEFDEFLNLINQNTDMTLGIHSPLVRGESKYDLIDRVYYDSTLAWRQLEAEMARLVEVGVDYILVHFPYFHDVVSSDSNRMIENGLKKLQCLQRKYGIDIICEPKLGHLRSIAGIKYLNDFPVDTWAKYNIGICIDIGDYIIATGEKFFEFVEKWKPFIKVVHLHNVKYIGNKHIWTPVHPSDESNNIKEIIEYFSKLKDVTFIFEHTPELTLSKSLVQEGCEWVRRITKGN